MKNPLGPGRPARYIASDGKVFSGRRTSGKGNVVGLGFLETMKARTEPGKEGLLVQDFRGILIYPVSSVSHTERIPCVLKSLLGPLNKRTASPLHRFTCIRREQAARPYRNTPFAA